MTGFVQQVPAGPVVAPLAVLAVTAGVAVLVRNGRLTPRRVLIVLVTAGCAGALVTLTFFPLQIATGDHGNRVTWWDRANLVPVLTIDVRTFLLNVVLFIPFGVLVQLWRRSTAWADAARWGLATSVIIEVGQWLTDILMSSGRTADVNDLIANTAGSVLGFWALRVLTSIRTGARGVWFVDGRTPRGRRPRLSHRHERAVLRRASAESRHRGAGHERPRHLGRSTIVATVASQT